ncbi:hypothetical protein AC578_935 [Pseudocercospora eumusae]|uniref:F-box domain-containing protein n=1 Tax=Pseudocercospora eumusae TaxID=321146 RepID=A0A139HC14_9PEZI|nr:hypothetical protein AC578_935 [Pseudocercospora eumusae]
MDHLVKHIMSPFDPAARYEATAIALSRRELNAQQPLMRLPVELRLEIYNLATGTPGEHKKMLPTCRTDDVEHGLMSTCHKIREELLPHYYSKNTFDFHMESDASFLPKMPKNIIQNLTNCRINIGLLVNGCCPDNEPHLAEVDLILENNKYAIQGELDACRTEDCLEEMTDCVEDFGNRLAALFEKKRDGKKTTRVNGAEFKRKFEIPFDHMVRFRINGVLEPEWEQDDADLLP